MKAKRGDCGFSLIEMIGVLAIIAVLLAVLLPAWIKRIDMAVRRAEVGNLVTVSNALTAQLVRGASVYDNATWTQPVAEWSMLPTSKLTKNARGHKRLYIHEQNANPAPGYTQDWFGITNAPPQNLRAIVVSVLGGDELDASNSPIYAGGAIGPVYFNGLWDLADGVPPTGGAWPNWNGKADDLVVQRVNYRPLFHHVVLLNREINGSPGFTINTSDAHYIARTPNNAGWDAYYLDGTVLGLCDPAGQTMSRYGWRQDISFVWEFGRWRAEILGAPESDSLASDFAAKAREFLAAARYSKASKGANQQGIVTAMYDFMFSYVFWANECPLFTTHGVSHEQVAEYRLLDWLGRNGGRLDEFSQNLVNK